MKVNSIKEADRRWRKRMKLMIISIFLLGAAAGAAVCLLAVMKCGFM